jgi:hypothetical protein
MDSSSDDDDDSNKKVVEFLGKEHFDGRSGEKVRTFFEQLFFSESS